MRLDYPSGHGRTSLAVPILVWLQPPMCHHGDSREAEPHCGTHALYCTTQDVMFFTVAPRKQSHVKRRNPTVLFEPHSYPENSMCPCCNWLHSLWQGTSRPMEITMISRMTMKSVFDSLFSSVELLGRTISGPTFGREKHGLRDE